MKSFVVTGASACGKTTLINEAIRNGYSHLPTHTTRRQRQGEIAGVHNVYLDRSSFEKNFHKGLYLEPSLEYAENIGVYYGTPVEWLKFLVRDNYCATPITPLIAGKICRVANVIWISLTCDEAVRRKRLLSRGISKTEVEARLRTLQDQCDLPAGVVVFDIASLSPSEILTKVAEL